MKQEVEIEFKNLLTKKEYNILHEAYPFPQDAKKQINYYFETENFLLKKHRSALRIREKDNTFTMTLKQPYTNGLLETHVNLTHAEAMECMNSNFINHNEMNQRLSNMGISPHQLYYYGSLITKRKECSWDDTLFVLDYSEYNNQNDYEFELEAKDYNLGEKVFMNTIEKSRIQLKETPSKIERFFASLLQN